jgi:hypothetical protein
MHTKVYDPVTGEIYIGMYNTDISCSGFGTFWENLRHGGSRIRSFFKLPPGGIPADIINSPYVGIKEPYAGIKKFTRCLLDYSAEAHNGHFYISESVNIPKCIPEKTPDYAYVNQGHLYFGSLIRQPTQQSLFDDLLTAGEHDY